MNPSPGHLDQIAVDLAAHEPPALPDRRHRRRYGSGADEEVGNQVTRFARAS